MEPEDVTFQFLREITDDFSDERKLGEGAFGVVYKGVTKNREEVAVKMLKLCDASLNDKQFQNELNNLRKLEHQNIVQVLGYCYETEKKPFIKPDGSEGLFDETYRALCLEYLPNGSLQEHLFDESCGLDWHMRFKIIKGTCEGLKYMHEEQEEPIYHLDLKPDNILLDKDMVPKIADFGLSRIFGKEPTRTTSNHYGTHGYQPPEYIDGGEISGKFDIFSLGVVMIRIISGSEGYPNCLDMPSDEFIHQVRKNWRNRLQATSSSDFSLEAYCHQVETCTQIALNCVEKDSQKRPDLVKITEKLNEIETGIGMLAQKGCRETVSEMTMPNDKTEMRKESSKDIIGRHQNINLKIGPSCNESLEVVDALEKSTDVVEELIVGRTEEKEKIMDYLIERNLEKIIILPIYGIGGIGKTTFARLIYSDPKFKYYYKVWVDVTKRFDLNKIGKSIISQLSEKESQDNETQEIHSCLMKLFSGKKILIVLDDLWEDYQFQLQDLKDMLYHADSNIIILVTTCSERVADRICTNLRPYKILPLTNDMCWEIIKQRSGFEHRDDKEQLVGIGLEIAQKCGGVALAARSLGFTLRPMNFDQWMEVKDSGIWNEPVSNDVSLPNQVLASLKLSYSYMDPCLKPCFTYCAIFPKGHNIVKKDIVYQWISLDFIKPTKLLSIMQLCDKYIVQLLGLSFFQHSVSTKTVGLYHEDFIVFTMHDLVHDLARMVKADEILDASKQGNNTVGGRYRFALLNDSSKSLESFTQYPSEIMALRFLESGKTVLHDASSSFSKFLSFRIFDKIGLHNDIFSSAKYLRVLDLSECSTQKFPYSIGNLNQLRYLNAPRVQDKAIPSCFTKFSKLIYLSLCGSSKIVAFPESVGEMEGLKYLDLSGCSRIGQMPLSFRKLKELVHLDLSNCSRVTNISESLGRLTNLEYLNMSYCSNIGHLPKHLGSLLKLRSLDLSYSSYIGGRPNVEILVTLTKLECLNLASDRSFIENLPEALRKLTNLKYLNLSCVERDPDLMGYEIKFRNLTNLPECKGVHGILEVLGGLTKLKYLNLSGFSCYVGAKVHLAEMSDARANLMELRDLNMRATETFFTLLECISKLRNLEHLDLSRNEYLRNIPYCFGSLWRLHTLNLSRCREMITFPAILYDMDSLKFLDLTGCLNLRIPEQARFSKSLLTLPHFLVHAECHDSSSNVVLLRDVNRTDLVIRKLENVKSAQEVRSINLTEKSKMEKMELKWTKDAERFVEDREVLGELVPPKTLEVLEIGGYNGIRFPEWFADIAFHLPRLVRISMSDLPKCNSLPPLGQLPNLRSLVLERMNGISEINWDLCGSRRAFPRLESFTLCQMESLKVWYTTYSGGRDGGSEFMFPNLSNLEISDCPNLRLKPCPHRAERRWDINGRSDGVISSWGERASQLSASSSVGRNFLLVVSGCNVPMHQWRLLHHLPGLTELTIHGCSDLSSSPEITRALSSLQTLQIGEVPNWLDQLASLQYLSVRPPYYYEIKAPHDGFPNLSRLRSLCLFEFGCMTTLRQWMGNLISLQRLEILGCDNENLDDLADSFGRLSSLNELDIICCDCIASLPESIGRLTSLSRLRIDNCDRIASLPESIQQLTKLKKLEISSCRELEKWCRTEESKTKLAHIKKKTIDGHPF